MPLRQIFIFLYFLAQSKKIPYLCPNNSNKKQKLNVLERYNNPTHQSLYYKSICREQENNSFLVKKSLNYLAVPNNLLLSLSLSHRRHANNYTLKHFLLRAREAWRISYKQRTFRSFLCSLFYALLQTRLRTK